MQQAAELQTTTRTRRRDWSGGAIGNLRLTATVGAFLIVLLAVEGATVPWIQPLLTVHIFVGMLLLGPVALKLACDRLPLPPLLRRLARLRRERAAGAAHARHRGADPRTLDAHALRHRRRVARVRKGSRDALPPPQGELHRLVRSHRDPRARLCGAERPDTRSPSEHAHGSAVPVRASGYSSQPSSSVSGSPSRRFRRPARGPTPASATTIATTADRPVLPSGPTR